MENHCEHFHPHRRWGAAHIGMAVVMGVILASLFALAFGWLVMLLWNWLMPDLFGLKAITYWQGFGICILSKLIFGGIGGHHPHYGKHGGQHFRPWPMGEDSCSSPGGDRRNWIYYRKYWKERGKQDFENYLRETGRAGEENREGPSQV
jgi:hypothetical protein